MFSYKKFINNPWNSERLVLYGVHSYRITTVTKITFFRFLQFLGEVKEPRVDTGGRTLIYLHHKLQVIGKWCFSIIRVTNDVIKTGHVKHPQWFCSTFVGDPYSISIILWFTDSPNTTRMEFLLLQSVVSPKKTQENRRTPQSSDRKIYSFHVLTQS